MSLKDRLQVRYMDVAARVERLVQRPGARERFREHRQAYAIPNGSDIFNKDQGGNILLSDKYVWLGVVHDRCLPDDPIFPQDAGDEITDHMLPVLSLETSLDWGGDDPARLQELKAMLGGFLTAVEIDLRLQSRRPTSITSQSEGPTVGSSKNPTWLIALCALLWVFLLLAVVFCAWRWGGGDNIWQKVAQSWPFFGVAFVVGAFLFAYSLGRQRWRRFTSWVKFWKAGE